MLTTTNQNSMGRAIPSTNPVQRKLPPLLRMLEVYRKYCGEHTIHKKTVMNIWTMLPDWIPHGERASGDD
jgi:hypothetical protein